MSVQTAPPPAADAITPTMRALGRRAAFWIAAGAVALLVAVLATMLTSAAGAGGAPLGHDNPAPAGGMAVAEVLAAQGVTVLAADTLEDAVGAAQDAGEATLFVYDADGLLSPEQIGLLDGAAAHTVVVDPNFSVLQRLAPGLGFAGVGEGGAPVPAGSGCTIPAALRAGNITGLDGAGLKRLGIPAGTAGYSGCFGDTAGGASVLVQHDGQDGRLSLVADPAVFANESVAGAGNAAIALGLLGEQRTLVWYLPTLADVAAGAPPSLAELSPGWVTPVMVLLVLCGVAAALAYGRRFGPLVVEDLPVTVRASETLEGRARLYARNSARLHALDALRMAATGRIAARLGLARTASLDEVAAAAASATGMHAQEVRSVLVDAEPHDDSDLLALSDRLLALENAVGTAVSPGNGATPSPTERM